MTALTDSVKEPTTKVKTPVQPVVKYKILWRNGLSTEHQELGNFHELIFNIMKSEDFINVSCRVSVMSDLGNIYCATDILNIQKIK